MSHWLRLANLGFSNVRSVGDELGRASTIKMLRSVMYKGMEALTAECLIACEKAGVTDEVLGSFGGDWASGADYRLDRMMVHGARRAAEMAEAAKTLEALGIEPLLTYGTVARQQAIGDLGIAPAARRTCSETGDIAGMIIDCHGHYTVLPKAHDAWREAQKAAFKALRQAQGERVELPPYPAISDDEIRETIEANQLRLLQGTRRGHDHLQPARLDYGPPRRAISRWRSPGRAPATI